MKAFVLMAAALVAGSAQAVVYNDAVGDIFDTSFGHLDIRSVTMTNDASNLYVTFSLNGNVAATNWGKYCMLFDTKAGGNNSGNPWGRNINPNYGPLNDFWMGSWADSGGGAQLWRTKPDNTWEGSEFASTYGNPGITQDLSLAAIGIVKFSIALSALGLQGGDTFKFDAITTAGGGSDPGVDHLSTSNLATPGWGSPSFSGDYLSYTVTPAPASLGLVAVGGLFVGRRRR